MLDSLIKSLNQNKGKALDINEVSMTFFYEQVKEYLNSKQLSDDRLYGNIKSNLGENLNLIIQKQDDGLEIKIDGFGKSSLNNKITIIKGLIQFTKEKYWVGSLTSNLNVDSTDNTTSDYLEKIIKSFYKYTNNQK